MDHRLPIYDELLDLTRRQAHHINELRAEVERLKTELERAKRLRKQRDHLLRFLDHDGLEATNNLAERELGPGVIARKLSAGNRTQAGAETHAVLASVLRTCRRQGRDILEMLGELLRQGPAHIVTFRHTKSLALTR
jgi:hypothetical protein